MPAERRVELELPDTSSEDLRTWASNVTEANPINSTLTGDRTVELQLTDQLFMGVELTFMLDGRHLLTLAIFADRPNEWERKIMEKNNVTAGGL